MNDIYTIVNNIKTYKCPVCNKSHSRSDAILKKEKGKTLKEDTKYKTGALGKRYVEKTEVFEVFYVLICKQCAKRISTKMKMTLILCSVILPILLFVLTDYSFVRLFFSVIIGLIIGCALSHIICPKITVDEAINNNALANQLDVNNNEECRWIF